VKYLVIYHWSERNWSAWAPDVPGCVATGATKEEVRERMREALASHFAGMREDGDLMPEPSGVWAEELDVELPLVPV
jgi:predicted RNase H-like HicB family nuclease